MPLQIVQTSYVSYIQTDQENLLFQHLNTKRQKQNNQSVILLVPTHLIITKA